MKDSLFGEYFKVFGLRVEHISNDGDGCLNIIKNKIEKQFELGHTKIDNLWEIIIKNDLPCKRDFHAIKQIKLTDISNSLIAMDYIPDVYQVKFVKSLEYVNSLNYLLENYKNKYMDLDAKYKLQLNFYIISNDMKWLFCFPKNYDVLGPIFIELE